MSAQGAPHARIHLTGIGGWGILTGLAVAAAAANTANNLLYLLLGLLMAAYPVSAFLSRQAVRRLEGDLAAPPEPRQGSEVGVIATLGGGATSAPAVIVELTQVDAAGTPASRATRTLGTRALAHVPARASVSVALPVRFARRGPMRLRLAARSPFPFGLVSGVIPLAEADVLVLPQADRDWRAHVPLSSAEGEPVPRRGEGSEILNIRDYAWGEDARRIDWKATARLGRPMLREFAKEQQHSAVIVVDVARPAPGAFRSADEADAAVESAISRAAGAAEELAERGWRLRVLGPGTDARGDARDVARALARLQVPAAPLPSRWWAALAGPDEAVLEFRVEAPIR